MVPGEIGKFKDRSFQRFKSYYAAAILFVGLLLVWLISFNRTQIGIRQVLLLFTLDVNYRGAAFVALASMSPARKGALAVLMPWFGISFASYYPNMIPYMHIWVVDRKFEYTILVGAPKGDREPCGCGADFSRRE